MQINLPLFLVRIVWMRLSQDCSELFPLYKRFEDVLRTQSNSVTRLRTSIELQVMICFMTVRVRPCVDNLIDTT